MAGNFQTDGTSLYSVSRLASYCGDVDFETDGESEPDKGDSRTPKHSDDIEIRARSGRRQTQSA